MVVDPKTAPWAVDSTLGEVEESGRLGAGAQEYSSCGGSGLGLSLVRQFARALGGDVELESRPGAGSVFRVDIPAVPVSEVVPEPPAEAPQPLVVVATPTGAPSPSPSPRPALPRSPPSPIPSQLSLSLVRPQSETLTRTVLVVDDNPINLRVAKALVERLGYRVATATNGLEAIEKGREGGYCAVLMDCHMPKLDGFEATRRLRALEVGGPRVPSSPSPPRCSRSRWRPASPAGWTWWWGSR